MKKKILIFLAAAVILAGVGILTKLPTPLFSEDYSTVVVDEEGDYLRVFLNSKQQWSFPPLKKPLPEKLVTAVINFEDKRFYRHFGVDLLAVGRAFWQNISAGEKVSGASTITMQVARLAQPKPRTISNKLIEMIQAVRLELKYDKEEILRHYLLHAPYGGNIIGYRAASLRYFGREPEKLTWGEAAVLAVLPNNPARVNPMKNRDKLKEKRDRLLKKLQGEGIISEATYKLAAAEPIPEGQIPFDLAAPHLARELKEKEDRKVIFTTINKKLQQGLNDLAEDYMKALEEKGVNNCAVLAVETKTGAVKAYLGSNDFFDQENSGRIDGVKTARSSGSILKPMLYALAMDEGLIIPESKLEDIPASYGAYSPYNANEKFSGVVSAREALIHSLNAPAVSLLDEYGVKKFYDFLETAGVTTLFRSPDEYGLPLILGGAEVNLWDVVSLYQGLANYGKFSNLHVVQGEDKERKELISSGSSYLTLKILEDLKRPGVEYFWREYVSYRRISWKTGTSYGNRDAWAVGAAPDWTIGVWVGNFSGEESEVLSGLKAAGPLLFRIFNFLNTGSEKNNFRKPEDDLKEVEVSATTGYRLKDEWLKAGEVKSRKALASRSALPLRYSPYEEMFYVNKEETERVCSLCWGPGNFKKVVRVVYPPEVIEYLKESGGEVNTLLSHRRTCPTVTGSNPIDFIYPQEGSVILIPRGMSGDYQPITLKAAHSYKESKLFWYLDQDYLGKTVNNHQQVIKNIQPGEHKLHVVDGEGHKKAIKFYIKQN